jgi:hypothetical protein
MSSVAHSSAVILAEHSRSSFVKAPVGTWRTSGLCHDRPRSSLDVFWAVEACSQLQGYRRFREASCLRREGNEPLKAVLVLKHGTCVYRGHGGKYPNSLKLGSRRYQFDVSVGIAQELGRSSRVSFVLRISPLRALGGPVLLSYIYVYVYTYIYVMCTISKEPIGMRCSFSSARPFSIWTLQNCAC